MLQGKTTMSEQNPDDVTPHMLREDMTAGLVGEIRAGFADLKATLVEGFSGLATRESFEEMVRLLREHNRQLEVHIRDEHPATQAIRHANAEAKRRLGEALRRLFESQRRMDDDLRGRDNDEPAA